jgi:transcriptional regulator with XRE-family HTH domain
MPSGGDELKERIKTIRAASNLSQKKFGEAVRVSLSAVQKWEAGTAIPSDSTMALICQQFHVNEHWLRTGKGDMTAPASREQELSRLVGQMLADRPESFRNTLITTLLRFEPGSPEWALLEKIVRTCAEQMEKPPGD